MPGGVLADIPAESHSTGGAAGRQGALAQARASHAGGQPRRHGQEAEPRPCLGRQHRAPEGRGGQKVRPRVQRRGYHPDDGQRSRRLPGDQDIQESTSAEKTTDY